MTPKLKNFIIIGKFTDDVYRQVLADEKVQQYICHLIVGLDKDGQIKVVDKPIEGISWESPVNLKL